MNPYFAVHPYSLGTSSAECLSSLLKRLAVAHGVTRHQFISHLRHWWKKHQNRHLPRCDELRWDGYSPNVELGIAALADATGLDVSGCTLIALKEICSANYIGSIKHIRSWCPGCFRDDESSGNEPYDRLLWRIQGIERCSLHRHKLITRCPACGALQKNDTSQSDLCHCSSCSKCLVTASRRADYAQNPSFGEAQIERLIARIGAIGTPAVLPLHRFLSNVGMERSDLEENLGDLFHSRTYPAKAQLSSLIAVSVYFDVDIVQLITEPERAAAQATLDFRRALPGRRHRPSSLRRKERSAWFEEELKAAIKAGPPYPSVPEFCRSKDFSCQAARASFTRLVRQLSRNYFEWKAREKAERLAKASRAIEALRPKLASYTEREVVRLVVKESDAPTHIVRRLLNESKRN